MMLPYQIYCDYLEDKGVNVRLLRTEEPDGLYVTNTVYELTNDRGWNPSGNGFGYGNNLGNGFGYGNNLGNGFGYGNNLGNGFGYGYGSNNGNGWGSSNYSRV